MAAIKKISGLTEFTDTEVLDSSDLMIVEDSSTGTNHRVKVSELSKAHSHSTLLATVAIEPDKWTANELSQSVTVPGAYSKNSGIVMVTPISRDDANNWCDYGLYLDDSVSTKDTVRFTCLSIPPMSIKVYVYRVG